MPKITNSPIEGMSQDRAFSKGNNKSLYSGLDIDIITNIGESTGIISNSKGNQLSFNIPDTEAVYIIELDGSLGSPSIVINGVGPLVLSIVGATTIQDVYNDIITSSFSIDIAAGDYGVFYNNSQIYIVGFNAALTVATGGAGITSSLVVSQQRDLSILGWGLLDEEIILITTAKTNTTTTPTNTVGQVWRVPYDDATNTINNINGSTLDPQYHLVYNNILDLSLAWEVYRELIGRVESVNKGSIYWLDDYNIPRALNVYNSQSLAIPPGLLGWKPDISTTTPLINGILNGGNLRVGSYQFAYQLYTTDGAITPFSPLSTLIPITEDSFGSTPYYQFDGAEAGTIGGKSIRVKIPFIDRQYDFIKLVVVFYELENVPNIFSFIDQPITDDEMEFLYTGNENQVSISLAEFLNPQINFDVAKTFTQKKNRLYVANTRTENFDLDWDSRAYRFSNGTTGTTELGVAVPVGSTYLYSRNGTGTQYTLAGLTGIADTLDLVNSYNDESGQVYGLFPANDYDTTAINWVDNFQFKYQTDGTTIGGEGPNISYTFNVKTYTGDQDVTTIPTVSPFINVTTENPGGSTQDIFQPNISELEPTTDGWDSIKNPFYSMTFPSHARGEIYRYSIAAYNTKGQQSYAKWIADIRTPEPWEDTTFNLSSLNGTAQELRAIYITFTIDTSSLPADITGFRILRCPRTDEDKTRLGVGITTGIAKYKIQYASSPAGLYTDSWYLASKNDINQGGGITQQDFTFDINFNFSPYLDSPINIIKGSQDGLEPVTLGVIKFPDFDFDKYQIGQASHIKKIHRYTITNSTIDGDQNLIGNTYWASDNNDIPRWMHAMLHKLDSPIAFGGGYLGNEINNISAQTGVGIDGQVLSSFSSGSMGGDDYNHVCLFQVYDSAPVPDIYTDNEVCGLGTKMLFVDYADSMTYVDQQYSIVSLCRFNQGAYGGPWRSSRYNNVYQAASDFIPVEAYNSTQQAIDVYGGDVYLSYYVTPFIFFHWGETYGVEEAVPSGLAGNYYPLAASQMALSHAFPVECSINTELRYGDYFNKDQVNQFTAGSGGDPAINQNNIFAKFLSDDYLFNDAMAQENNLLKYFPKPFLVEDDQENRTRVWYSDEKFDREIIDSWRLFGINNYKDLEGMYGEIVDINNLNEVLFAHQNRAIARISSQEMSSIANTDGAVFQTGTGDLLSRYDYISKETGTFHQHSVITTPSSIYHYDVRLNKLFKLTQQEGLSPLTDIKGLSAFFRANVEGNIKTDDTVLLGKGVHGVYDSMFNKAYFTFERTISFTYSTITPLAADSYMYTNLPAELFELYIVGQTININGTGYYIQAIDQTANTITLDGSIGSEPPRTVYLSFTIAYNELLNGFESFYGFHPRIYLGTGKRLFSANPYDEQNSVYQHNIGDFGVWYDQTPTTSMIEFIVNYPDATKLPTFRYDLLEFWSEVTDNLNQDYPLESITGLIISNDYQTTGNSLTTLTLGPQGNFELVRNERTWRTNRIFDYTNPAVNIKPYLRDKYTRVQMFYDNSLNRYLRLHDINSTITLSYNV